MKQKSQTGLQIAKTNLKKLIMILMLNYLSKWLMDQETDQVTD